MNSKMTTNSQLLTTEPKQKQTKQTTRTGKESQKWRSHEGLSAGRGWRETGRKGTGNKKHNWWVQNRQGEVKNSIGNGEEKEKPQKYLKRYLQYMQLTNGLYLGYYKNKLL